MRFLMLFLLLQTAGQAAEWKQLFNGKAVPERKQWFEPVRGHRPDSGYIGLQNHDGRSTVYFKEVSVK